jgi:hypothetical protein
MARNPKNLRVLRLGLGLLAATAGWSVPAAGQAPPGGGFPLGAADAQQVVVRNGRIATLTRSAMDLTTLTVHDARTGGELLRKSADPADRITFNGRFLIQRSSGGVSLLDIDSRADLMAFETTDGETVDGMCVGDSLLRAVVRRPDVSVLFTVNLDMGIGLTTTRAIPGTKTSAPIDLLCSDQAILVRAPGSAEGVLWNESGNVESLDLSQRTPLLLTSEYLYATNGSSAVVRRALTAGASWEEVYADSRAQVVGISADQSEPVLTVLQLLPSGAAELVSLARDGAVARRMLPSDRPWVDRAQWSLSQQMLVSAGRRDSRSWLFVDDIPKPAGSISPVGGNRGVGNEAGRKALDWLERQLSPPFWTRDGRSGRLIDSYEDDDRRGWTYDAALAAVTFTAWGQIDTARQLLTALAHLQGDDGSWPFAYDPDRAEAVSGPRYIGAMAWVVMAANFFEWETHDTTFDVMADRALRFFETFINRDLQSPLAGGISMGPAAPATISTENNVDAMSAFLWRGRLAGRREDGEIGERLREFVWQRLGTERPAGTFFFKVGATDPALYLDAQTWTTLALGMPGLPDPRLTSALDVAERQLRGGRGHVDGTPDVTGFRDSDTASPLKVWSEGTEGMVAARLARGEVDDARIYHEQTARLQSDSGGIPYATESPDGWSTHPSVAGTAWFLLNELWPPRNPFNPDTTAWMTEFSDRSPMVR